jgi:hypothetical protein
VSLAIADLSPNIVHDTSDRILAHAAEELRTFARSAGALAGTTEVRLSAGAASTDGFAVRVAGEAVAIEGESPRGALNGAYWLLERLGFLWVQPGEDGARFVAGREIEDGVYGESPAVERRTLVLGNDGLHDDWRTWMEFASRNRLNSVFFHDTPPSVLDRKGAERPATAEAIAADGKGWLFERWDSDGAEIRKAAAERGIALQFGGHHLPALLRRELFTEHPGWFPFRKGARDARYNLCTSSSDGIAEVRARASEFFARFAGASVYHLWADDILGGGWCSCPACAELSPSDQALRATNVLAEVLAKADPAASIAHLAYHDTIAPPERFEPAPNVTALYAPRNRNYAFAIDDPASARNAEHLAELRGLGRTFAGRADALAAFEYYSDSILYKWLAPPNLAVMPADAAAYRAAGVFDYGNLAVTPRPWYGPVWHAWWFGRCAWQGGAANSEDELSRFCAASFERDAPVFAAAFAGLEEAHRPFLDTGGLERMPRHDVLDFSDSPRGALRHKAEQMHHALQLANGAVTGLPLMPAGLGAFCREDLAVQLAAFNHLAERVIAWDAALDGRKADTDAHLSLARVHLSALEDWDRTHSPAAYANLGPSMLRAARWHTEQVAGLIG